MRTRLKLLSALPILLATSGCATGLTAPVVSDYCRIAAPIMYNGAADTPDTVRQIEEHNSKWVCVCENDCPKK